MVLKLSKNAASLASLDIASIIKVNRIDPAGRRNTTTEAALAAEKEDVSSNPKKTAPKAHKNTTPQFKRPEIAHIPALEVFPTLRRFHEQEHRPFRPRDGLIPPGIRLPTSRFLVSQKLNHLYHDLGVMVFAGTTDHQTRKIGWLLKQCMDVPGGLPSFWRRVYDRRGRFRVYRLGLDDLTTVYGNGPLMGCELSSLAGLVAQRFCTEAKENLQEDPEQPRHGFELLDYLGPKEEQFKQSLRAVTHPTVNGPRRLPIHAYVCPTATSEHIELNVEFFSVGTGSYLGSARRFVDVTFHSEDTNDQILKNEKTIAAVLDRLPIWQVCRHYKGMDSIMLKTLDLEEQVWAKQWKWYDSAQGERVRLGFVKSLHKAILTEKLALWKLVRELENGRSDLTRRGKKKVDEVLRDANMRLGVLYPKKP